MFLTRKKADKQTQDAVADALSRVPDLTPQVEALTQRLVDLQDELARAKAEQAERAIDLESRLQAERETTDTAVTGLLQAVNAVSGAMREYQPEPVPVGEPDPRVAELTGFVIRQDRDITEINDTVKYLLDAPPVIREIVKESRVEVGVQAMFDQHVRPMGVR